MYRSHTLDIFVENFGSPNVCHAILTDSNESKVNLICLY